MTQAPPLLRSPAVTWKSVSVGLIGVLFLCGLSAFNDWVLANTLLVGNFMPIGLLLFFLVVVIAINAPLRRWLPALALSGRELTVAMCIVLVCCGLPGSGLMRYLPTQLVGVWKHGSANPEYAKMLDDMELPTWLFPKFDSPAAGDRGGEDVVQNYYARVPGERDSLIDRVKAVPWAAWRAPAVAWSVFSIAFFGAMACILLIVRRQWVENERLPFPLAGIFAAVVEEPPPGRALNDLFRTRSFWIAFVVVFLIHSCNALYRYDGKNFPEIRIRFDLNSIFANEPWVFVAGDMKSAGLLFCIVGITYFLPSQISLSSWVFYVALNIMLMVMGTYRVDWSGVARADELMGGVVPYALAVVWVGRKHWLEVIRQMGRGWRDGESRGRYLPYAFTGWALIAFSVLGVGIMYAAGMTLFAAVVSFFGMLTLNLVVARIVAETGLPFVNLAAGLERPYLLAIDASGDGPRIPPKSFYLTQLAASSYSQDMRESSAVFMSHSLKLADDVYGDVAPTDPRSWRRATPFLVALATALIIGFVTAAVAKIYVEYTHAVSLSVGAGIPDNHSTNAVPPGLLSRAYQYSAPTGPPEAHSRVGHFLTGAAISTALIVGRLSSAAFPLHPVGFLMAFSWPMSKIWFSILVGWFIKTCIVAFGGTTLYRTCREFFIGLILGEAFVAAFWLVTALVLNALGLPYYTMYFLPS
jgi:hypothetical protein